MNNIIKKIFSIDTDDLRFKIIIFGIKICIAKPSIEKKRKQNPFYEYVKNNVDITTVPPATGFFRDFQLATLALLIDFDQICKQNNVHYWLDFGTLIGAIRHKGFIPWDDDIDLCLFREDYERIEKIINNNTINPDIIAESTDGVFLKIKNKKTDLIFIDLFPVDKYGEIISIEKQLEETKRIKKVAKELRNALIKEVNFEKNKDLCKKVREEQVLCNSLPADKTKTQFVWGIDFVHLWKNWFINYDVYFPFKTIKFEGYNFPCMNKPEEYLTQIYGNYMAYPKNMRLGHNILKEHSKEDKEILRQIINEKGLNK